MWQNTDDRTDAEYNEQYEADGVSIKDQFALCVTNAISKNFDARMLAVIEEADRDMEPHKRDGYFEMMCDMADYQRKWNREEGK